eukprot:4662052-Pleurochrysis_carterae.AAC.2
MMRLSNEHGSAHARMQATLAATGITFKHAKKSQGAQKWSVSGAGNVYRCKPPSQPLSAHSSMNRDVLNKTKAMRPSTGYGCDSRCTCSSHLRTVEET